MKASAQLRVLLCVLYCSVVSSARPCSIPWNPVNGVMEGSDFSHGGRVSFRCYGSFRLVGSSTLTCSNGRWSGVYPTCTRTTFCYPTMISNAINPQPTQYLHGQQATYRCLPGFTRVGPTILTCNDGRWNGKPPSCKVAACDSALGMESGAIKDNQITASSKMSYANRPSQARLNGQAAWCSGSERYPTIEIDFGKPYKITGLATQGITTYRRWVGHFVMSTNMAGSTFSSYREQQMERLFQGNTDASTVKKYQLQSPFIARKIRIKPLVKNGFSSRNPACMRVEVYGCDLPTSCVMVGSRVYAKWGRSLGNADYYYKAYVRTIDPSFVEVDIETRSLLRANYKRLNRGAAPTFVLDVVPKPGELSVGTRVIADWAGTYYSGTITHIGKYYSVRMDDGDRSTVRIEHIRILKNPNICK